MHSREDIYKFWCKREAKRKGGRERKPFQTRKDHINHLLHVLERGHMSGIVGYLQDYTGVQRVVGILYL